MSESNRKIDWMYEGPKSLINREDYLLGKKIDKNFVMYSDVVVKDRDEREDIYKKKKKVDASMSSSSATGGLPALVTRQEDPLAALKLKEIQRRQEMLNNPVFKRKAEKLLRDEFEKIKRKAEKKEMKKKLKKEMKRKQKSGLDDDELPEKKDKSLVRKRHDSNDEEQPRRRKRHDSTDDKQPQRHRRHSSSSNELPKKCKRHDSSDDEQPKRRRRHSSSGDELPTKQKCRDSSSNESPRKRNRQDSDNKEKWREQEEYNLPSARRGSRSRNRHSLNLKDKEQNKNDTRYRRRSKDRYTGHRQHNPSPGRSRHNDKRQEDCPNSSKRSEEIAQRLQEMQKNAKWKEQVRKDNVEFAQNELKKEANGLERNQRNVAFINVIKQRTEGKSVAEKIQQSRHRLRIDKSDNLDD